MSTKAFIFASLMIIIAVFTAIACHKNTAGNGITPQDRLTSFSYISWGTIVPNNVDFNLTRNDDGSTALLVVKGATALRQKGLSDSQLLAIADSGDSVTVSIAVLDSVGNIFFQHKMNEYKPDYRPKHDVLDGASWAMTASFSNNKSFSSGGYAQWPGDDGIDQIVDFLTHIYLSTHNLATTDATTGEQIPSKAQLGNLNYVSFSYRGMKIFEADPLALERTTNGKVILSGNRFGNDFRIEVNHDYLKQAQDIIINNNMTAYSSSYIMVSPNPEVQILDGFKWSFEAQFDSKSVSSYGSNAWPENSDGLKELQLLFYNIFKAYRDKLPKP